MNEIEASFNEDFCVRLEYHLTKALANSPDELTSRFWCDGISMPFVDSELSLSNILVNKQLLTKAWMGPDGQGIYDVTIKFGPSSIFSINNGLSLTDCLPETLDWWDIDIESNTIEVRLL